MIDLSRCRTAWRRASRLLVPVLAFLAADLTSAVAEGWRHVIDHSGIRGSAIGGGFGNTLYAGLGSGDVFRSDDNGRTWSLVNQGLVDDAGRKLLPKAFVVTPSGRVIRGGDNASWLNKVGSPIFTTDNQGGAWTEIPLPFSSPPRNPAGIGVSDLVVHQGAIYFSDLLSEGVWKSVDHGATWTVAGEALPTVPFVGFVKTYYAIASAGNALLTVEGIRGVLRSTDGGVTWAQSVNGIPGVANSPLVGGRTWTGHDVVGSSDGTAFAVVDSRLFRSRDAGASWVEVADGLIVSPNPFVPSVIQPAVRKVEILGDRVFVTTTDGNPRFFEGTESGESWSELPRIALGGETASILAQSFFAYNGALYAAGSNGVHRLDLGTTDRTPIAPRVTTSPAGPYGLNLGSTLRIGSTVRGTAPFTYEWRLNDQAIVGQTASVLEFAPSTVESSGQLSLVVRNAAGAVTNTLGLLTVAPATPGAIDYAFRPQTPIGAGVTAIAFGPDGSVYFAGSFASQFEAYSGLRKTTSDGQPDTSFVTGALIGVGSGPGVGNTGVPSFVLPLADGSVLAGAAGSSDGQRYYRRLLEDGSVDATWPWPAEAAGGPRAMVRLPDGRFLIAGGSVGGIHRLNEDGTLDVSFRGPTSIGRFQRNYVTGLAVLPDGRILIAGLFNEVDGVARVGMARLLPDGALDRSWAPASLPGGSEVKALAVLPDGRILIGGAFLTVGGQPHRNLARLNADGSVDATLGDVIPATAAAGVVNAFAVQPDGRVWVGGAFQNVSGRDSLFRLNLDGTVDTTFPDIGLRPMGGGASPVPVLSLNLTPDGRLWIGSAAAEAGGLPAGHLFKIRTDVEGPAVGYAGLDQTPDLGSTLVLRGVVNGSLLGVQWRFNGVPVIGATGLDLSRTSVSEANSGLYDLVVTSAGGSSTSAPVRVRVRGPVVVDRQPESVVGLVGGGVNLAVQAFGRMPLTYQWSLNGVDLTSATLRTLSLTNLSLPSAGDYTVRVTGADGSVVTSEPAFLTVIPTPGGTHASFRLGLFATTTFTTFQDIVFLPDGGAIVCGNFATVTNGPNAGLARLNAEGAVDPSFAFVADGLTEFIAMERQSDGRLVILVRSGAGYLVRRLLENGAVDPSFAEGSVMFGSDLQLAPDGGVLVIGSQGVLRFDTAGQPDLGFTERTRIRGAAQSLSVDDLGRIYVTGTFTTVTDQRRLQFVRLSSDGTLDETFAPDHAFSSQWSVTALADGALVGDLNGFYRFDSSGQRDTSYGWGSRLAEWDLSLAGVLVGILPNTAGDGVLRQADGSAATPISTLKLPLSFSGYSWVRVAPDGAFWLALGGNGGRLAPSTLLFRLHGTVTPLALVVSPVSQTVPTGARVTFTAAATGTSRVTYQWKRNGSDLAGETNATLVLASARPADNGDYTVDVHNRSGTVTSRPATLLVLGAPEILSVRGAASLGLSDFLNLTVTARGVAPLGFQWRKDGNPLPGATAAELLLRAVTLTDAGRYDVVVTNELGSTTSDPIAVTVSVRPGAVIGSFPAALGLRGMELNVLPNGDFLVDGAAFNRFGERQFNLSFPDGTSTVLRDRIAVDAARQRIYAGPTRRVRAYGLDGGLVTGYAGPSANVRRVRVEAAGTVLQSAEGVRPPFQRLDDLGALDPRFTAAVLPSLDALPLADGKILVLTFGQRTVGGRFVYNTILDRLLPDGSVDASFGRVTNVFSPGGQANRMFLDRNGRILVLGGLGTENRERLVRLHGDGTRDATFQPPLIDGEILGLAEQRNGRLVLVGAFGMVNGQPRSRVARLNADGSHDENFQPGAGLTTTSGQNVAHDVDLLPTGEIVIVGTFDHVDGQPRNGAVLLTGDSLDLYFTEEPTGAELELGGSTELRSLGTGTSAVSYQWYKDGEALAGATGGTLNLAAATAATAGDYQVRIRNAAGELPSRVAQVRVVTPPEISVEPSSLVVDSGGTAVFTVEARGLRLRYQWRFQGVAIVGATNPVHRIEGALSVNGGAYSVVVGNPAGEVISADAALRVRPAPAPTGELPSQGIVGEMLFEGDFNERSKRFLTQIKGSPTFVDGFDGHQAARIRSSADWVQLGTGTARLGGTAYSASFWIWPEERGSLNVYSLTMFAGSAGLEHYLYLGGDDDATQGQRVFLATRGLPSVHSTDDRAFVPNLMGRWTHVAVTYRGGGPSQANNFAVYIDGVPVPLVNSSNPIAGSGGGNGLGRYGPTAAFRLDDFRIYNRALDPQEIARLHQPGSGPAKPEIVRAPVGATVAVRGSVTLTVEATGADLFYEWYRGDNLLPKADGPTLVLGSVTPNDAGQYRVVVSNSGGSVTSASAALVIQAGANPFTEWAGRAGLTGERALPAADADGDGVSNLAEFLYGTSPTSPEERPAFKAVMVEENGRSRPAIEFRRRRSPGPVRLEIHVSRSIDFENGLPAEVLSTTPQEGEWDKVRVAGAEEGSVEGHLFFRFRVQDE